LPLLKSSLGTFGEEVFKGLEEVSAFRSLDKLLEPVADIADVQAGVFLQNGLHVFQIPWPAGENLVDKERGRVLWLLFHRA